MIHRKFDGLKFRRTYIGGSKQQELKSFLEVQGTKEDNSECDWIEYRRMLSDYLDDTLNVLLSWRYLTNVLSIVFAIIALFLTFNNIHVGLVVLFFSSILLLTSKYLNRQERKILSAYDFSLDTINKETGLSLSKN